MADRGQVRLAPVAGARTRTLTLASPRAPEAHPLLVVVRVNGRQFGTVAVRRDLGWNEIRLSLPADLARPLTVELRATTVRFPGDRRALGVAVARVTVEAEVRSTNDKGRTGETRGAIRSMLSPMMRDTSYF
jgi:hypothetical protein